MTFEVNGQAYILHWNNDDERWYLITTAVGGRMKGIPVIGDEAPPQASTVLPMGEPSGQAGVN